MSSGDDVQITSVVDANGQVLPLHGTSIGGNYGPPVKQERPDDAEIRELAAKMREQQKQQAAQQANRQAAMQHANGSAGVGGGGGGHGGGSGGVMQPPLTNGNGQTNIMSYLSRHQKLPNGTMQVVPALASNGRANGVIDSEKGSQKGSSAGPCDEESIKGHFGWAQFSKVSIPYIYRLSEKYCSVRMIELKLLGKYLNCLHPDIYSSCTCVRSYYITDAEARLFIEINHKHCDGEFGRDIFTQKDLVVRLSDATKFYQFLDICYRKLVSGSKTPSEKCGFIRINKESVVPYTVRNNQQVVPLFYFEGETENLKTKAELLNGWDLAYLKFCCKVQGIRNELFSSENVAVISLTDIKSYFPNGTEFEDYWPSKVVDSNLLIGNRANVNNSVNWTRQPSAPPPKITNSVGVNSSSGAGGGNSGSAGPQKSQQQHSNTVSAAAAQQQHLLKQRAAAAAAAAAGANGVANAGNFPPPSAAAAAAAAFNSQAATAAAAAAAAMLQTQGNTRILNQALANAGWMNSQNNVPHLHAQMLQQTHANANRTYRDISHISNMMLSGNTRQTYPYNNPAISMSTVNSQSGGNAPPPLVRSAAAQNANHMSNVEQSLVQQQTQQQQRQQHHNSTFNNHVQHSPNTHSPRSHHGHVLAKNNGNNSRNPSLTTTNSARGGNNCSTNAVSASAAAATAAAVAANMHALLGSSFNYNMPSTRADYTNLALWNQLTPAERLLFTQQMKGVGIGLGVGGVGGLRGGSCAGGGAGSGTGSSSGSSSASQKSHGSFPALPSLPLDTDLITMLDYNNPNKQQQQASVKSSKAAVVASSGNSSDGGGGATFTKPTVPPLISDEHQQQQQQQQQQQYNQQQQPISKRHRGGGPGGPGVTTIPLNSTQALEDFEKKFNMTDEMRAVIHKVLANPDLSTSIQTNANNHNNNKNNLHPVPSYISPPMSPAIGANVTTLSLASNPNVTITPQLPGHFLHSPSSSCSSSSASTTAASPLGSASVNSISVGGAGASTGAGGGVAARQKSVICSTKINTLPLAILSLASAGGGGSGGVNGASTGVGVGSQRHKRNSSVYGRQSHSHQFSIGSHLEGIGSTTITPSTTPTDVIDLSSSRRSLAASAFHQQQQQQQQAAAAAQQQQQQAAATQHQRMTAALAHHAQHMQNGTSSSGRSGGGGSSSGSSSANGGGSGSGSGSAGNSSGTGGCSSSTGGGGSSGSNSSSNSASLHLQRHAAMAHAAAASASDGAQRLCIIPEIPTSSMNLTPYKVQRVCVDKHLVPCINMKAYNDSEQLMTLTEFQKNFFPTVALDHCKRLIEALGVELYKANRRQVQILMEYDRSYNENMPLVQVRDIIKYMTQLTFMTRQSEQPPSKRTRTS